MVKSRERVRHLIPSLVIGLSVALLNCVLDIWFTRRNIVLAETFLNDLLIGAAAGIFAYVLAYGQARAHERRLFAERIRQEAALQERRRIAHEIHDNLLQCVTGVILQLEAAGSSLSSDTEGGRCALRALDLARKTIGEMRRTMRGLRPELLEAERLPEAIQRVSKDLSDGTDIEVHFSLEGPAHVLSPDVEAALLRISQEALTNVVRHAHAHDAHIHLQIGEEDVHLSVKDNGCGFVPGEPSSNGGFGLTSMRERAADLGGSLFVNSQLSGGTQIVVLIPISSPSHSSQ